jgi:hypothetical protein
MFYVTKKSKNRHFVKYLGKDNYDGVVEYKVLGKLLNKPYNSINGFIILWEYDKIFHKKYRKLSEKEKIKYFDKILGLQCST